MRVKAMLILLACSLITVLLLDGCIYLVRCPREITLGEEAMYEVYYVSTPKQRKELKKLISQEDVDRFLEDFWKKLDPTPDTPVNELRTEYYKRYYYSNANFGEGETTGWRTDRGRVFIIYGPPDEIAPEVFALRRANSPRAKSLEVWTYDRPASRTMNSSDLFNLHQQCQTFIFADTDGFGGYTQVYSTEQGELDDSRFLGGLESEGFRVKSLRDYPDKEMTGDYDQR